jgi:mannose-6-phosphate isomerase-like protein (cupin superfamily)
MPYADISTFDLQDNCKARCMMEMNIKRGMKLRNAFNKETFVFGPIDDPDVARFGVILEEGGSGGGNAIVHIHPGADEHFTVKSGRIKIVIEGDEQIVESGGHAVVPRGKPHFFANAGAGIADIEVEFRPAQQHLRFFANFASLAANRGEWFSKQGDAKLLLIALVLDTYRDHLYLAGPPIFVQKLLFAILAPLARLRGYRMALLPAKPEQLEMAGKRTLGDAA